MFVRLLGVAKAVVAKAGLLVVLLFLGSCGGGSGENSDVIGPESDGPVANVPDIPDIPDIPVVPDAPDALGVSVSGTIRVQGSIRVDNDVNDPAASYTPNDSLAQAQTLPSPVTLNGFASKVGTGNAGDRFAGQGDLTDVYRVNLAAGQSVTLQVADYLPANPGLNDIDMYLYDRAQQLVKVSQGQNEFESLTAQVDGIHFVMVDAFAGASKYVLYLGNNVGSSRLLKSEVSADIIPFELLMHRKDSDRLSGQSSEDMLLSKSAVLLPMADGDMADGDQVSLLEGQQCQELLDTLSTQRGEPLQWSKGTGRLSAAGIEGLALGVERPLRANRQYLTFWLAKWLNVYSASVQVGLNHRVGAARVPNDDLYPTQWHYPAINLPAAWDLATGGAPGNRPLVAVIDSGVLMTHPDLAGQLESGFDFIRNATMAADGDGIDADPDDVGDRDDPASRSTFHGTHIAGTVAASSDNTDGMAGVAWGARIMPLRVLGVGGGSTYDVIQSIRYAAGLSNDSNTVPVRRADIINLSLGCSGCFNQVMQDAITAARAEGVIVIAAGGNQNDSAPFYPAAYPGVVGVGAVNSALTRASYSNAGNFIDVAAPGGDGVDRDGDGQHDRVLSTGGDDSSGVIELTYSWKSGTSMAAGHVAGVAALLKAIYPALTPQQFDEALASGAVVTDLGPSGRDDEFGHGMIDALKAVGWARNLDSLDEEPLPGVTLLSPSLLDFTPGVNRLNITVSTLGASPPSVVSVTTSAPWLAVNPTAEVDVYGIGRYVAQVDRQGLVTGVYDAEIRVTLAGGNALTLPVFLQVLDQSSDGVGNPGKLYVQLRDDRALSPPRQALVTRLASGEYQFTFDPVPQGEYRLYAGSDIDNDDNICGAGETCGAYPSLDNTVLLTIDSDRGGLDFDLVNPVDMSAAADVGSSDELANGPPRAY
jgi:serine protease